MSTVRPSAPALIEAKRDGGELSDDEIRGLIRGFTEGAIPDYQMAAFAMAVYFRGMSPEETASLTRAMLESGEVFDWPDSAPPVVDKHSTGGIGDKVSLVLAPLVACDDRWVPMISGRGLGITGGTLDKLESIPGFRIDLSRNEALAQLGSIGVAMMGQTEDICPADRKLYALRDVSATVPSQPLIVASILSKKLAESLDELVLDVKFGTGAFMRTREEGESLGEAMRQVGEAMGVRTHICYHPMDEPLGRAVGNALEVAEAIEVLEGRGPDDLHEVTLELAEKICSVDRDRLEGWLSDGTARRKWGELVAAQGGDPDSLERLGEIHRAETIREVRADLGGRVERVDAGAIGRLSLSLGAGRARVEDAIDFSVGMDQLVKVGDELESGDLVGRIHAPGEEEADRAEEAFRKGFVLCEN